MSRVIHKDFGQAEVWLEKPDLIRLSIKSGQTLDVETSRAIREWILKSECTVPYKLLSVPEEGANVTPEIRKFLSEPGRMEFVKADAMVVNNFAHRLLADFYLRFNRPKVATRLFANEETARTWLESL